MNDRIHGIILKQSDYRENGALVAVLSQEHGKLSLSASGVRKMTSKNAGSLLPFTFGEFTLDYRDDRTLFHLKSAHTLHYYRHVHEDLTASAAANVLLETSDAMVMEGENDPLWNDAYAWLQKSLELLEEGKRADLVLGVFLARILDASGMAPEADQCVLCGKPSAAAISVKDGGFLCADCAQKAGMEPMPVASLRAFRLVNKAGFKDIDVLAACTDNICATDSLLIDFLDQHGGIHIRSFAFFQRLRAVSRE